MKLAQTNLSELAKGGNEVAPASRSAPALRRFTGRPQFSAVPKAAEDCRSPKPRGILFSVLKFAQPNLSKLAFSAGGARGNSPRREPWVKASGRSSSGRSVRVGVQRQDAKTQRRQGTANNFFASLRLCALALKIDVALPPLRGLRRLNIQPTAYAVGYYRSPLRGFDLART